MKALVLMKAVIDKLADIDDESAITAERDEDEILINPYDRHAIEAALQLKKQGSVDHIAVLCCGADNSVPSLQEALAMGANEAIRVEIGDEIERDVFEIARILVGAIEKYGAPELILTGMQSFDIGAGAIPGIIAEMMGRPHASYVEEIEIEDQKITVKKTIEGGFRKIRLSLPVLLSIANTANEPRYVAVGRIMKARKQPVPAWDLADITVADLPPSINIERVFSPPPRPECIMFDGEDDPEGAVGELFERLKADGVNLEAIR
ncbi:MAG: electron transfer flavoprotein subunit beta/FixA family protein [Candidatus Hodarchaeales archaeon]|jgi:electron transfer flavoprotein beta subunit